MLTTEFLRTLPLEEQKIEIIREIARCKKDPIYCIETYFSITDAKTGQKIPLILYPYQKRAIKAFNEYNYNMSMKSRQMGFTTISSAYTAWFMATKSNMVVSALANKLKTSRRFLKSVKDVLDNARRKAPWLIADYVFNDNGKDSFTLKTGSNIKAESNNEDACRGEVINLLVIDEVAAIDRSNPERMIEIWSSVGITLTRSQGTCIAISTPKGQSGWYFEQYTNAEENGWNVIDAHWSEHPIYSQGMYQYIKDDTKAEGGYVKHYNEEWPEAFDIATRKAYKTKDTYAYVLDGKLRSPWYDMESKKLGLRRTKCELDCSFSGSGGEVIDSEVIRAMIMRAKDCPILNESGKGIWKSFRIYKEFNKDHGYIISADVATGDGSDFSAFVVIDLTTKEVVATYKESVDPIAYAKVLQQVAISYSNCLVIVEHQGPGLTVLLELKDRLKYSNIYYSALKKQEVNKTQKRKLGFWQGENTRSLGGDKLEECINNNLVLIPCENIINELHTWIWDKDGKRRHAPGKHDDLIMALANAMYYIFYVISRRDNNKDMMKKHFEINRFGMSSSHSQDLTDFNLDLLDFNN